MQDEDRKTLKSVVATAAHNKDELADIITVILDEYTQKTGTAYIALLYPPSAFDSSGQLKHPEAKIKSPVAATIVHACKLRSEIILARRIAEEEEAMKNGFITCA